MDPKSVDFDIVNCLLKFNWGRDRSSNFVNFVVLSALLVGGWVKVVWR